MPARPAHPCPQRAVTEALARDELSGAPRATAELHLEHCEACRMLFRQRTVNRFPKIRNYTVVSELGRGGFGVVYKALHHSKERSEALKVLFGQTPQRTAYFENEVRLVARLRHPNIATLYDASLNTTPLYYSMEFVEGQQLDDFLRSPTISLEQRIGLVKTVAAAIDYAHQAGVIHRDLKPQNILIDPQGQPRIVDFGIAKRLGLERPAPTEGHGEDGAGEGVLGTYGYISPEQLAGREVDRRADVYSLGALLFHVITGQPARFAPQAERLSEVLHERQVSRSEDLAAIIACCVRPDPAERYPTCAALVHDLDNYLAGRPILAQADLTPGYRVARVAALVLRNHPFAVQTAATLVLAAALSWTLWVSGVQWQSPGRSAGETTLVAFMPSTLDALRAGRLGAGLPGLDPTNPKSRRLLYGRLMERLAVGQPRVVVWDYYFPDCQPQFDAAFIRGVQALSVPVLLGSERIDVNGEPVLCPAIRAAAHGWGTLLGTPPGAPSDDAFVPLALQRGFSAPLPALSLVACAAARYPDCTLELGAVPGGLELHYRKLSAEPNEPRWRRETDKVPIIKTQVVRAAGTAGQPEDKYMFGRFPLQRLAQPAQQVVPMEQVLAADAGQLRRWFAGRAVLIGQMVPGTDEHRLSTGQPVFGCQVQALALDDLLGRMHFERLFPKELAALVCLACLAMAVLMHFVSLRKCSLRLVTAAGIVAIAASVGLALWIPHVANTFWATVGGAAACAALGGGAAAALVKALHQRQLHLTPGPVWSADAANVSTTVLASAPKGSSSETSLAPSGSPSKS